MKLLSNILNGSAPNVGSLILRVTLAGIIFPHGAQKVLGLWGGAGLDGTYTYMTTGMGIPGILVACAIATEFLAPFFLLAGFLTRFAAFALSILMIVITQTNCANGFFMNWMGNQKGEGMEYSLLYLGAAIALLFFGAGKYSVDALCCKKCPCMNVK